MKIAVLLFIVFLTAFLDTNVFGQVEKDLQTVAETEKSFASFAAEKGTKAAFLEYTAPDGIMFSPNAVNAKDYWNARAESKGLLSWQPSFVDISSNGILGWTTGPWEFRPKGKEDAPVAFGEFVTLWQKQPDGKFRFVLDIGISHEKAQVEGVEWKSPADVGKELNSRRVSAGDSSNGFFQLANQNNLRNAYKTYAADDIRVLREGKMPLLGKDNFLSELKKNKINVAFAKRSVFFGAADLAYITNTYTLTREDKSVEKGNFVQIWKMRGGKWQIVLDLFNPIPEK
jgi:ketosteroid isomerase-like protein